MDTKPERIRDPLHDIIKFSESELDRTMWNVIETPAFQRLRRVKQLGFSELTFPGATHSRFAHSIGVFHTARQLMSVIKEKTPERIFKGSKADTALAAALLHDVGHGMFSHAFESIGDELELEMANHEKVSETLIRDSEISDVLKEGGIHSEDVASLIGRKGPQDLYDAVVSSQFDADRLDYMRRDRLMTGVKSAGIDYTWLLQNLEIGNVDAGEAENDETYSENLVPTFVLGKKSIMAAESYVLALFHLYPTIYLHKATLAAETLFKNIMLKTLRHIMNGSQLETNLPDRHPFQNFILDPMNIDNILKLDDTVFWGSLGYLSEARDPCISKFSKHIMNRDLPKAKDIGLKLKTHIKEHMNGASKDEEDKFWTKFVTIFESNVTEWDMKNNPDCPSVLVHATGRDPYSTQSSKGVLNQIHVKEPDETVSDIRNYSPVIKALKPFKEIRAYLFEDGGKKDHNADNFIQQATENAIREARQ